MSDANNPRALVDIHGPWQGVPMSDTSKQRTRAEAEFAAVTKQPVNAKGAPVLADEKTTRLKALRQAKEAAEKGTT
jgi:hypothetical protein